MEQGGLASGLNELRLSYQSKPETIKVRPQK